MTDRTLSTTADLFADGYDRWSDPLYAYVSRSVAGRQVRSASCARCSRRISTGSSAGGRKPRK
jgi:hypothetical protein